MGCRSAAAFLVRYEKKDENYLGLIQMACRVSCGIGGFRRIQGKVTQTQNHHMSIYRAVLG